MKLALFALLGLLVGSGGGSAMSVLKAKKTFAAYDARRAKLVADSIELAAGIGVAADSSHAAAVDSTHAAPAGGDSVRTAPSPAPAHTTEVATTAAPKAAPDQHQEAARQRAVATVESHGGTTAGNGPLPPPKPIDLTGAAITPASARLAKIFGAMPSKDAARVLVQLADGEVHEILLGLPNKQAAGIMQFLPSARAAAISKLSLKGGHE